MDENNSFFFEKFKVPEILRNHIHKIFTDEEIVLLNHLADKAEKISDITTKFPCYGISLIESLYKRGFLTRHLKGGEEYYKSNTLDQIIKRFVNHNPKYQELSCEEKALFQEYIMGISIDEMRASEKPLYRVVPVEETIEDKRQLIPYHQARHFLQSTSALAVIDCLCRVTFNRCSKPRKVCLALGEKAKFFIERGIGEEIDIQRGLEILEIARENDLVHSINDKEDPNYLCNCCECCCLFVQGLKKYGIFTSIGKSDFTASLDSELCNLCGICVEKCIFGAISCEKEEIVFDEEKCFGCGLCAYHCPQKAIKLI